MLSPLLIASLFLAAAPQEAASRGGAQAGASLLLPDFDPAVPFETMEKGMSRLDPIAETLREANETLQPLIEEYRIEPSLENQAKLENALAEFTAGLARKIRSALAAREKVDFAFQDVLHGVGGMKVSLDLYGEELAAQAKAEEVRLAEVTQQLEAAAEAWDRADDPADKAAKLEEFKLLHRQQERHAYRARYLASMASHYAKLAQGVEQLSASLRTVQTRVGGAYDRLEDAGEMLAFAAGYRRDATGLVARYQSFFGEGEASVRQVLERIQSIQGRLEIFDGATQVLDEAGPLLPMIQDMDDLTRGLRTSAEAAEAGPALTEQDYWEKEIQKTIRGE